jgi:hypothetical protein
MTKGENLGRRDETERLSREGALSTPTGTKPGEGHSKLSERNG